MSNLQTLFWTATTETSRQAIRRDRAGELQDDLNHNCISRLLMMEEMNEGDTVVATQKSPIAVQDEMEAVEQPFPKA